VTLEFFARETPTDVIAYCEVPGLDPRGLRVEATRDTVTLNVEAPLTASADGRGRRVGYASVRRSLRLPAAVRPERAQASIKEGLLRVRLPKDAPDISA
jgi:HSP20 family protein